MATSVAGQSSTPRHLNKTIEKLEAGEVVFGTFASDKSPSGGAFYGGAPVDFVLYDMEHEPLDFVGFRTFLQFMPDRSSGIPCRTLANKENVAELIRKRYRFLIVPTEREFEAVRIGRGMAR